MDEELILVIPGPACTSKRVKDALLRGDLCHREPEFTELLFRIREALPRCLNLGGTHEALLVTGSGTAAMEMAVISSVRAGRGVLVVNNGVYGDRMIKIAKAHGIPFHEVRSDWTVPPDPEAVRAALAGRDDVDAVVLEYARRGAARQRADPGGPARRHHPAGPPALQQGPRRARRPDRRVLPHPRARLLHPRAAGTGAGDVGARRGRPQRDPGPRDDQTGGRRGARRVAGVRALRRAGARRRTAGGP